MITNLRDGSKKGQKCRKEVRKVRKKPKEKLLMSKHTQTRGMRDKADRR